MKYDGKINIAIGHSAESKTWKNNKLLWSDFVQKLSEHHKTKETFDDFIKASKQEQGKIKDVGGYVGGYLRNGRRSPSNVVHRQVMTLDIDFAHLDFWEDFLISFDNAAVLHATHKHCSESPRYRLIMPLNRECTPDEYAAVSRQFAGILGIDLFDNTTFETNRLMFWPSTPKDVDYYFRFQDGPWLDVDQILDSYIDWTDTSLWPTSKQTISKLYDASKKQEDPEKKKGVIGAFCRAYTISEVIENILSKEYTPSLNGRYTYLKGSTASGLIVYEDKFAYSHHGSDPCSGKLCNAFDLVRIHLFGHLDDEGRESSGVKTKSFLAMQDFARKDKKVKNIIASEKLTSAKYDFIDEVEDFTETQEEDVNWMSELESDARNNYLSTAININLILANDSRLKGAFKLNAFDGKRYVVNTLPWRRIKKPEPIKNVDYSGVRNYIESIYGIAGTLKIDDSLALEFEKQSFHPIKDYLDGLQWDGKERIKNLLPDYFGVIDNLYTREAMTKMLVGAVARVYRPGIKFDLVLTIIGEQGTKKSSFIKKLGKDWYSDTFTTVHGKEAFEQIQGFWLIEIAEMAGFRKAENESVKLFISKQKDSFRPAYARTTEDFSRQCVFFATSNKRDPFSDPTGSRRFLPVDVNPFLIKKDVWKDLDSEVDQIWSEAVHLYQNGEPLFLSAEAEKMARVEQLNHSEVDERKGLIEQYLDKKLPKNWDDLELYERINFLNDPLSCGEVERDYVCAAEVWCECLGRDKKDMGRYNTREVNDILKALPNWEYITSTKNFKLYGTQKYYTRKIY